MPVNVLDLSEQIQGSVRVVSISGLILPSFPADGPSGLVIPVLFFRLCFLRLACGEGGGSSLGLVALVTLGLELRASAVPLAGEREEQKKH